MRKALVAAILLGGASVASAKPSVTIGASKVMGEGLDEKAVGTIVKASQAKLLACYTKAPPKGGGSKLVMATITIGVDGKVTRADVPGISAEAHACFAAVFSKLRFAKPTTGVTVDVITPLTFDSGATASTTSTGADTGPAVYGSMYGDSIGSESGVGPGSGGIGWGPIGRNTSPPGVTIGEPSVKGDLDKAIVRRYIKRNIQKLHHCYEKQLQARPTLAGTVKAEFTIGADGLVSASTASGIKDEPTEACIAGAIKAIEFPKPRTGTVTVKYPLTFKPAPPAKKGA